MFPVACPRDAGSWISASSGSVTCDTLLLMRIVLLLGLLALQSGEGSLDDKIAPILPKPDEERWLQIPWRSDFAAARAEANREGKPLFLWMMDGNPLGCT